MGQLALEEPVLVHLGSLAFSVPLECLALSVPLELPLLGPLAVDLGELLDGFLDLLSALVGCIDLAEPDEPATEGMNSPWAKATCSSVNS